MCAEEIKLSDQSAIVATLQEYADLQTGVASAGGIPTIT